MLNTDKVTIVLVADTFNVPIFQQTWLLENDIILRDEFSGSNNIFTPMAVNVSNEDFTFLVVPERIQVVVDHDVDHAADKFARIIGKIADRLPHSPIIALGFNFDFAIPISEPDSFFAKHRELFVCPSNPLGEFFSSEDARFGVYVSRNSFDGRLRLDIKPVSKGGAELFRLGFNYHHDISTMNEIRPLLTKWDEIFTHVKSIAVAFDKALEE